MLQQHSQKEKKKTKKKEKKHDSGWCQKKHLH